MDGYFKQTMPGYDISIEKSTQNTPMDGKYHIIITNKIVYSTKVLKFAQLKFTTLIKEMGYLPKKTEDKPTADDVKHLLNKQRFDQLAKSYDAFWDNSSKFRKGGRLNKR